MTARLLAPFSDVLRAAVLAAPVSRSARSEIRTTVLIPLDADVSLAEWWSVDDRVMGGISRSTVERATPETLRFAGTLSLEEGGGFASTRRSLDRREDLSAWDGIALRVRGDGRNYQLRLRTDAEAIPYRASFPTRAGEWTEVRLAFDAFVPTWRGRPARDAPPLDPGRVESLGFMVSGEQAGQFELEIARIEAWRTPRAHHE